MSEGLPGRVKRVRRFAGVLGTVLALVGCATTQVGEPLVAERESEVRELACGTCQARLAPVGGKPIAELEQTCCPGMVPDIVRAAVVLRDGRVLPATHAHYVWGEGCLHSMTSGHRYGFDAEFEVSEAVALRIELEGGATETLELGPAGNKSTRAP